MSQGPRPAIPPNDPFSARKQGKILTDMPLNPEIVAACDGLPSRLLQKAVDEVQAKVLLIPPELEGAAIGFHLPAIDAAAREAIQKSADGPIARMPDLPERTLMAGEFMIGPRVTSGPNFSKAFDLAWAAQFTNICKAMIANPRVLEALARGGMVCRYQIMPIPVPAASAEPHPDANPPADTSKPLPL